MTFKIQVLTWDRHKDVAGLNQLNVKHSICSTAEVINITYQYRDTSRITDIIYVTNKKNPCICRVLLSLWSIIIAYYGCHFI